MSDTYITVISSEDGAREKFVTAMQHAKSMLMSGESVQLSVGPAISPISAQQRRFFHGPVLTQISEQVFVGEKRERFTADIWKRHLKNVILEKVPKYELVKLPGAKRATPRRVYRSTEQLGVRAYSKFIDDCIDYAIVEWGVRFDFNADEREAARYVAKPSKEAMQ